MEDRPVQEGYHRPERKKKRAGLPAFFLAVIVLALLAAALLRIWLGYRSGSLAAGDITVLRRGLPFGVGAAGLAAVLAVAGLLRKKRRRGFAAWGLALALVALVLTGGLLYADHYLTGKMTTDDDFDSLSASDLHQTATEADGRLEREERFSEALSGLEEQLADLPSFTEVDRYLLSNNDIPAEALAKLDTGKAPRSSYLSSDASKIQVFVLFGLDGVRQRHARCARPRASEDQAYLACARFLCFYPGIRLIFQAGLFLHLGRRGDGRKKSEL